MPPSFSSQAYWDQRFTKERDTFEWLQPSSRLLPLIEAELSSRSTQQRAPTVLHIGPGTSRLSLAVRRLVEAGPAEPTAPLAEPLCSAENILHAEFSSTAIALLRQMEAAEFGTVKMRYEPADLLHVPDVLNLQQCLRSKGSRAALILDKSTADAIACGPDVAVHYDQYASMQIDMSQAGEAVSTLNTQRVHPLYVLAMHLAALTAPGGVWLCLTYSSERLWFLEDETLDEFGQLLHPSLFWTLERKEGIELHNQGKEGVGTPRTWHWLYHVRRKAAFLGILRHSEDS